MRREIRWSDRHGLEQEADGARAVAGLREFRGRFAQRRERGADVLLRGLRAREAAVRIDVAVLLDELAIRDLRGTRTTTRKQLLGRVAREAVTAARLLLHRAARGKCRCELGGTFVAHRSCRFGANAHDERLELCGTDGVGVDTQRLEFG